LREKGITVKAEKPVFNIKTLVGGLSLRDAQKEAIVSMYEQGNKTGKQIFEKYVTESIVDVSYSKSGDGSYYHPITGRILLDGGKDNLHGFANTYFHEHGHYIDYIKQGDDQKAYSYHDKEFKKLIKQDIENMQQQFLDKNKDKGYYNRDAASIDIARELFKLKESSQYADSIGGVSDIYGGYTKGVARDGYGHSDAYMAKKGNKETEAFADMFETFFNAEAEKYMRHYLPLSYNRFLKMTEAYL
jgi:hypothetical protein